MRLLLPLIAGLFCADACLQENAYFEYVPYLFFLLLALLWGAYFLKSYACRWLFGFLLVGVCFVGGYWWGSLPLMDTVYSFPKGEVVYKAIVEEKPEIKEKSVLCQIR